MVTVCCIVILDGAVYSPVLLTVPAPEGLIDQITVVLLEFVTVAENCCVCPPDSVAVNGVTLTTIGEEIV